MPTVAEVNEWLQSNVLDTKAWDNSLKKEVAIVQAERNLRRWYPEIELTLEIIAQQAVWELQGIDPVVKYSKQGIKHLSEDGDRIEYNTRDKVAPEVRELLGAPLFEKEESDAILEGGILI